MTIRVRDPLSDLDAKRVAAAVTSAVLNPALDDVPGPERRDRVGRSWVRWSDALAGRKPSLPRLD